jgi:transcriptional regulator with XRE-family HTH domain
MQRPQQNLPAFEDQILSLMGGLIRQMRQQRGLSQAELSQLIKVDRATISRIENGKVNLHFVTLGRIAAALDCFVDVEMVPMEGDE